VIIRNAYGGVYCHELAPLACCDFVFAWPTAEIAVMGPEGAANICFRKEINGSSRPRSNAKTKNWKSTKKNLLMPFVAAHKAISTRLLNHQKPGRLLIHAKLSAINLLACQLKSMGYHHFNLKAMEQETRRKFIW
jgi:acetyl-CoA carboxylase carboxyltransferase component